jgi:hypothetical protein
MIVMILIRSEPEYCKISIIKTRIPVSTRSEKFIFVKKLFFYPQVGVFLQTADQNPGISWGNHGGNRTLHWPGLPVTDLALEYFSVGIKLRQRLKAFPVIHSGLAKQLLSTVSCSAHHIVLQIAQQ